MNPTDAPLSHAQDESARGRSIAFLNFAHALDHFVLLIYPTVVIGLEVIYGRPYAELIALSTAAFVAFGVFSLPAGWLADRWSRRNMMAAFYLGCGVSLVGVGLSPNLVMLAVSMFGVGMFAAIYHPVGMPMLLEASRAQGRTVAFNGVCGNLGAALAAGIAAAIASWFGWRAAFLVPAVVCIATGIAYVLLVPDDRHRTATRTKVADVPLTHRAALIMFGLYIVISLCSGLVFNTMSIALPKVVDERAGSDLPLLLVGSLTTAVFMCGAIAQLAVGRMVERIPPYQLFAVVVAMQLASILWASYTSGVMLMIALAIAMAAIYAQVTVGDLVIARYTADAWRGRIYAVRYFLTFVSAGAAVSIIAFLYGRGGFDLLLLSIVGIAAILLVGVIGFVILVGGVERDRRAAQPAE
jgi:MFS family permease